MNATLVTASTITGNRSLYLWFCPNGHKNGPEDKICAKCSYGRIERHASVHTSERTVIFRNPLTDRVSIPGRSDEPMHPKLAADGYVREEIESAKGLDALEKRGFVHVATNFDSKMAPPAEEKEVPQPKSAAELGLLS